MSFYPNSTQRIDRAVAYALAQLGEPYVDTPPGAQPPKTWDCSKLTSWAWRAGGITLSPYSPDQFNATRTITTNTSLAGTQKGDLIFWFNTDWGRIGHVAMLLGDGRLVEAGSPVKTRPVYWNSGFLIYKKIGRIPKIGPYNGTGGGGNGSGNERPNVIARSKARVVGRNAISISKVAGTPQEARFAAINVTNESIFLSQDSASEITKINFFLQGKSLVVGDEKELSIKFNNSGNDAEFTIESPYIQNDNAARRVASLLGESFNNNIRFITVTIFGNPLVELGDIVKFNYETGKILSDAKDFYIVTRVEQNFGVGLETTLVLKPLNHGT